MNHPLYLIPFLHQTTTTKAIASSLFCCILFHFYIKPQHCGHHYDESSVVSYSISTSNHNAVYCFLSLSVLYLIPFLHQTTTQQKKNVSRSGCILFHFYIKPQQGTWYHNVFVCCILFHFYIKPQPCAQPKNPCSVVSYSISTSNHNHLLTN